MQGMISNNLKPWTIVECISMLPPWQNSQIMPELTFWQYQNQKKNTRPVKDQPIQFSMANPTKPWYHRMELVDKSSLESIYKARSTNYPHNTTMTMEFICLNCTHLVHHLQPTQQDSHHQTPQSEGNMLHTPEYHPKTHLVQTEHPKHWPVPISTQQQGFKIDKWILAIPTITQPPLLAPAKSLQGKIQQTLPHYSPELWSNIKPITHKVSTICMSN